MTQFRLTPAYRRFLTRAALVLGLCCGTFRAALPAQVYPGGVAAPFYWSAVQEATVVPMGKQGRENLAVFAVYRPEEVGEGVVWSISSGDSTRRLLTTRQFVDLEDYRFLPLPAREPCGAPVLRSYVHRAGGAEKRLATLRFHVGQHSGTPRLPVARTGQRPIEIAAYDRQLDAEAQQRIESYLALSHGITLDQESPRHYLSGTGTIVWDAHRSRNYRHRIFGVGRDVTSGFDRSENDGTSCSGNPLGLSLAGRPKETAYAVISDDDGSLAVRIGRIVRTWSLQVTAQTGLPIRLRLDPGALHTLLAPDNEWTLLIDTTGSAAFSDPVAVAPDEGSAYALPKLSGPVHFTFAPRLPFVGDAEEVFESVALSPNPSPDGRFALRVGMAEDGPLSVTAYDALGRRVRHYTRGPAQSHLLRGQLPATGMYFLEIRSADRAIHRKLTVQ